MKPETIHRVAGVVGAVLLVRAIGDLATMVRQIVVLVLENQHWITPPPFHIMMLMFSITLGSVYVCSVPRHSIIYVITLIFLVGLVTIAFAGTISGWSDKLGSTGFRVSEAIAGITEIAVAGALMTCVAILWGNKDRIE